MQRIARSFLSKRAGDSIPYTMAPKRPFPNGNASVHTTGLNTKCGMNEM